MKISKIFSVFFVLSLVYVFTFGQNSQNISLQSFDKIVVFGNINVQLEKGNKCSLKIEVTGLDVDDVITEVSKKTLKIRLKSNFYQNYNIKAYVTYKVLRKIVSGVGANIESKSVITGDKLDIKANSRGKMNLEVNVNAVEIKVTQGANIKISGKAEYQKTTINTAGILDATNLLCDEVYIKSNTGGEAKVLANKEIDASASMGGVIHYYGTPKKVSIRTEFGGKIVKEE